MVRKKRKEKKEGEGRRAAWGYLFGSSRARTRRRVQDLLVEEPREDGQYTTDHKLIVITHVLVPTMYGRKHSSHQLRVGPIACWGKVLGTSTTMGKW